MPRAKAELPDRATLAGLLGADGRLAVRVTPGARDQALAIADGRVLAKVRAKPEDGRANAAVIALLAAAFGVAPSRLRLLRGATSRDKLFQLNRESSP